MLSRPTYRSTRPSDSQVTCPSTTISLAQGFHFWASLLVSPLSLLKPGSSHPFPVRTIELSTNSISDLGTFQRFFVPIALKDSSARASKMPMVWDDKSYAKVSAHTCNSARSVSCLTSQALRSLHQSARHKDQLPSTCSRDGS